MAAALIVLLALGAGMGLRVWGRHMGMVGPGDTWGKHGDVGSWGQGLAWGHGDSGDGDMGKRCVGGPTQWVCGVSPQWDADEGDAMGPGKGIKCRVCVSLVKKVQKIVGDDPDEVSGAQGVLTGSGGPAVAASLTPWGRDPQDAINDALNKVCSTGRRQRSICKQLLKKLRQQLSDALQNNDDPRDVCTTLGLCKG